MDVKWSIVDKFIAHLRYSQVRKLIKPNSVLCDLGCGFNGAFLISQSSRIKRGYGFDKKVSEENEGNIILKNIENLEDGIPLQNEKADCATMLALLEHLSNPETVLLGIKNILTKDGTLILTSPSPNSKWLLEFLAFKVKIISEEEIKDHKHYYTKDEIVKLLHKLGFTDIHVKKFLFGFNTLVFAKNSI